MLDTQFLANIPKLKGSNWFEWKKEAKTLLLLAGLDGIIGAEVPTDPEAAAWMAKDRKVYTYIFFLINPNHCAPIIKLKSGHDAWKKLVAKYKNDSATTHMILCQQFYSVMHDPSASITVFIDAVYSVAHQLKAIGYEPTDLEISDKLLIGLHQLWSPIHTAFTFHEKPKALELETITTALK